MADFLAQKRHAVVTGANKGIGLEICRQLASVGVVVVLTARNEKRGIEALDNLKKSGVDPQCLEFHQLDVTDPTSIPTLAHFISSKFGKLDILVNNAGVLGANVDFDAIKAAGGFDSIYSNSMNFATQTCEQVVECLNTNYYGVKRTIEALLPLLQLSDSPRIVNVSSSSGKLAVRDYIHSQLIPSEGIRETLSNIENLTEEKLDEVVNEFLRDFKDGSFTEKGWPSFSPAYTVSKAILNSYTRILAKKYPSYIINCICPGYIKTDINNNSGILSVEEGGATCVRLALLPRGADSGLFFFRDEVSSFV